METYAYTVGSLVFVTAYGPYWGLRGNIQTIDVIKLVDQSPVYFYLVAFYGEQIKEPLWLMHDDIAIVEGECI